MRSNLLGYVFGSDESQTAGLDQRSVDDYVVCFVYVAFPPAQPQVGCLLFLESLLINKMNERTNERINE